LVRTGSEVQSFSAATFPLDKTAKNGLGNLLRLDT
jgi:hypothetical protein